MLDCRVVPLESVIFLISSLTEMRGPGVGQSTRFDSPRDAFA